MLSTYDTLLLPGGEDRGARLRAEADHERLVAAVRTEPVENGARWWRQRIRFWGHESVPAAGARRVALRP